MVLLLIASSFCVTEGDFIQSKNNLLPNYDFNIRKPSIETGLSYADHTPIIIQNEDNFTDYGFSGNGSEFNPFVIENLNISSFSPSKSSGILIEGTSSFFVIRNCLIYNRFNGGTCVNILSGIGKIVNNTCFNASTGISVSPSFCVIENNTIFDIKFKSIHLVTAHNAIIHNNTLLKENYVYDSHITIAGSHYCQITNNTLIAGYESIQTYGNHLIIYGNTIIEGINGIHCNDGDNITITYNLIVNSSRNAIEMWDYYHNYQVNYVHHNWFINNNGSIKSSQVMSKSRESTIWYDEESKKGNYWDSWKGWGSQTIYVDGDERNTKDKYPLDVNLNRENKYPAWFIVPVIVVPLITIGPYIYLKRKPLKEYISRLL